MKTIYLDVLLCLNLYINYFVLRATAKLLHAKLRTGRCLLAAGVGSLFSLPNVNLIGIGRRKQTIAQALYQLHGTICKQGE